MPAVSCPSHLRPPNEFYGTPVRIVVPSLNIDLPGRMQLITTVLIKPGRSSDTHAHFALPSMPPNDKQGNTLIYGHNSWEVFGHIKELKPGDVVNYLPDNGHTFFL